MGESSSKSPLRAFRHRSDYRHGKVARCPRFDGIGPPRPDTWPLRLLVNLRFDRSLSPKGNLVNRSASSGLRPSSWRQLISIWPRRPRAEYLLLELVPRCCPRRSERAPCCPSTSVTRHSANAMDDNSPLEIELLTTTAHS